MEVRPDDQDRYLDHPCQYRRKRRADHTEGRSTEFSEDQDIVEDKIDDHRDKPCLHRHKCLTGLSESAGVHHRQGKGQQLKHDDIHVLPCILRRCFEVQAALPLVEEEADKEIAEQEQDCPEDHKNADCNKQLHTDRLPDAFLVTLAVELRRQDARSGDTAQQAEVEDEDQLIDDRHTAHRFRADLADHDVVQQRNKCRNDLLNKNREQNGEHTPVKSSIPDIFVHRRSLPFISVWKGLYQHKKDCQATSKEIPVLRIRIPGITFLREDMDNRFF